VSQREEHSGNPGVRISAGRQHIASAALVKEKFHQIMKSFPHCLGSARASRAHFGAPAENDFAPLPKALDHPLAHVLSCLSPAERTQIPLEWPADERNTIWERTKIWNTPNTPRTAVTPENILG
jgi:hypothetical protein